MASLGTSPHLFGQEMTALPVLYLYHPQVPVGLEAFGDNGVYAALVGGTVEPGLAAGGGNLHQHVTAVTVPPMHNRGEGARRFSTAHQGRHPQMGRNRSRHGGTFTTISPSGARFAPVSTRPPLTRWAKLMLATLTHSIFDAIAVVPTEENVRTGVYVMAGIFGLLVSGVISCVKEMQAARADSRAC
jgi:hypothetical protein